MFYAVLFVAFWMVIGNTLADKLLGDEDALPAHELRPGAIAPQQRAPEKAEEGLGRRWRAFLAPVLCKPSPLAAGRLHGVRVPCRPKDQAKHFRRKWLKTICR